MKTIQTILVTGADGFIGSHLVEFLHKNGHHVRCFVHKDNPPHYLTKSRELEWSPGDLKDSDSIQRATQGCDMVFHLAGISRYKATVPEKEYFRVNVEGTRSVLEACRLNKVRKFVYVSSIEAVGLSENGQPLTEQSIPRPRNIYGMSKLEGERVVQAFHSQYGMHCVIVRIGATYGPRERMMFERLIKPISKGIFVRFGDGSALIEFSYVKNQVQGIWQAALRGRPGETYFLSDPRSYSYQEIIQEIANQVGVRLRLISLPPALAWMVAVICEGLAKIFRFYPFYVKETARPPFSRQTLEWAMKSALFCNTTKAKEELAHTPPYSLSEGIRETIQWYRAQGWL